MSDRIQPSLKGITAQAIIAMTKEIIGARKKTPLSAPAGTTTSFTIYLRKSAKLCSRPKTPTTLGPRRIITAAQILRSAYMRKASASKSGTTSSKTCPTVSRAMPNPVL